MVMHYLYATLLIRYGVCRKDQLKKKPVMGKGELNEGAEGLGDQAEKEGLAGKIGKAFD